MKLNSVACWALRQSLGSKRGTAVIALLSGPVGAILDVALGGKPEAALGRLDEAIAGLREVLLGSGEVKGL